VSKMDIDAMSPDELKQKVRELLKQKEEADATIASLRQQLDGGAGGGAAPELASPATTPKKSEAQMAEEMQKQKQAMIDAMLADGTISQEEYEEMIERNRREKEEQETKARKANAWCAPCCLSSAARRHVSRPRGTLSTLDLRLFTLLRVLRTCRPGTTPRPSGTTRAARRA
jgi:hypothetical protein